MNNVPAIEVRGLQKRYGSFTALRGIDLLVQRGEVFGFLGPNGAGKTTTIRCLLNLIHPSGGSIRVMGYDPQREPVEVHGCVGYLPGELRLDDNLTAEGALRFFAGLRGGKVEWRWVQEMAERIALDLKRPIKNFSKGNKQKVGVIQALMHRPPLLLLDEPTSGLDPLVQQEVLRLVAEAQQGGATVFFSSHVLSEVQAVANRVGIIRSGEVVEVASTNELIHRSLRRARIQFKQPVDGKQLGALPGVTLLGQPDDVNVLLQVEGEMDGLVKALAQFPVRDFATERPSLEEIFLAYYDTGRKEGKP